MPRARYLCSLAVSRIMQSVLLHKSAFLQKIMDYVTHGYADYCCGYVNSKAALSFASRFERYYQTGLDRNRRARAKRAGHGCAVLLMHELNGEGHLFWVLLVSPGDHPARKLERLRRAFDPAHRLAVDRYELVSLTRPGCEKPSNTWRLTKTAYQALRSSVIDTARRGSARDIRVLLVSLFRTMGFRGARLQVGGCCALFRNEWKRVHRDPVPALPNKLHYISRVRSVSVPLSKWIAQQHVQAADPASRHEL